MSMYCAKQVIQLRGINSNNNNNNNIYLKSIIQRIKIKVPWTNM